MKIQLEIDDTFVPALQQFLATRRVTSFDPTTGQSQFVPMFRDIQDLVAGHVGELVRNVASQFPTPEVEAQLEQIRAMQREFAERAKPRPVRE